MRRFTAFTSARLAVALFTAFLFAGSARAQMESAPKSKAPLSIVLGQPRSVQVSKPYGMVTDSVPIIVPPGRKGVEPHLSLTYSSGGGNGLLGVGWDLQIGYIELNRRNGLPASGDPDTYNFSIGGLTGELHNDGTGFYRSRTELVYRRFMKLGAEWLMQDGQGNNYIFGSSSASRIDGALWLLDTVVDPLGNSIAYKYFQDQGAFYPLNISYTAYASNPGGNQVNFTYEARPDVRNSFVHGVSETLGLRLKTIVAETLVPSSQVARTYQLVYTLTPGGQSVISQILLIGDDGTSTIPLRNMNYTGSAEGWDPAAGTNLFDSPFGFTLYNGADYGTRVVDIDGDGCADMIFQGRIYLGDCKGNFLNRLTESNVWSAALALQAKAPDIVTVYPVTQAGKTDYTTKDNGVRFLDVNGDGRTDIIIANSDLHRIEVWLNTYNPLNPATIGWQLATAWTMPVQETNYDALDGQPNCGGAEAGSFPFTFVYQGNDPNGNTVQAAPSGVSFVDVNGDGLPDIVWSMFQPNNSGNLCIASVYLNNGSGWVKNNALSHQMALNARGGIYLMNQTWPTGWDFFDVNGDGKADLVFMGRQGNEAVLLFNGQTWALDENYTQSLAATSLVSVDANGVPTGVQPFDFNHDGLADLVFSAQGAAPKAYRNTGSGFQEDAVMEQELASLPTFKGTAGTNPNAQTAMLADVNGDGLVDLIGLDANGNASGYYPGGHCPNNSCGVVSATNGLFTGQNYPEGLLTDWEGPLGEKVEAHYERAPSNLTLAQFVPTILIRWDARQDQTPTQFQSTFYTYHGGNYTDRKFLGFYATDELDPDGNTIQSDYIQQELFAGQEGLKAIIDSTGFLRYRKYSVWTPVTPQPAPDIQQGALTATSETFYDPGVNGGPTVSYSSNASMTYDAYLNIKQLYKNPNTSVTGLDRTTEFLWATAANGGGSVWSIPSAVTVYSGSTPSLATMVSNTIYNYDNLPFGQVSGCRLTSQQDAVQVTTPVKYVTRATTYDQYGNIVGVEDRNGNTTSFTYDTATYTNRVSGTDPQGRTIRSTFDPRFGAVLTDTDAGGNTTSYQYDPFGRLSRVTRPGDSSLANGTTSYFYGALSTTFLAGFPVVRRDSTSGGNSMTTVEDYDAFGQVYRTAKTTTGNTILTTTDYDSLSMPIRIARPHYGPDPVYYTTLTRDPMHRITQIQDADGGITTRSYAGLQVTETDRRGLATVTTMNPSQKVTARTLQTATGTATTQYVYDVLDQLTSVIRADGSTSTITWDMMGRRTSMSDPNTGRFTYQYDNEEHITGIRGADGKTIHYTYDSGGNLLSRVYPDGTTHTITYGTTGNATGRVASVKDAAGTIAFTYDARGRVIQHSRRVAAKSKTYITKYGYDSADELASLTYPDGYLVNYAYDGAGNVSSVVDGGGTVIARNFAYNANNKLTGLTYGNGVSSGYAYDVLDRMTTLQSRRSGGTFVQNLAYTYDPDSNVASIQDPLFGNNEQFAYDNMNRLVSATGVAYGQESYTYDAIGNLLTKGSAAFVMDKVHPERAVCAIVNTPGSTNCTQNATGALSLNYDARGNLIQMGSLQYTYDPENRLLSEASSGAVIEKNIYDFWGDRVVQQTAAETRVYVDGIYEEGATAATRHIRTPNLLLATIVTPLGLNAAVVARKTISVPLRFLAPASPSGDQRPFLLASAGISLLIMLIGSCFRTVGSGRRLRIRLGPPSLSRPFRGLLTLLLVLSLTLCGSADGWALTTPAAPGSTPPPQQSTVSTITTTTTNAVTGEKRYYYHLNHLGSVHVITDDSGNIVTLRQYKPFGEMVVNGGVVPLATAPFTFQGQRADGSGNLEYFNARFYSPFIGRFLSADTEIHNPTTPQALNRYAFAGGNPVRYVDPSGHSWWDFVIGAAIFTAIVVFCAVSGGTGLALFALAMGGVGLGVGAAVAAGLHYNVGSEDFWQIAMTGAILGAAIGAGAGQMFLDYDGASAASAAAEMEGAGEAEGSVGMDTEIPAKGIRGDCANMVKSMAFGGPQSVMTHYLQGGGTDGLLLDTVKGTGESALSGAIFGRLGSRLTGPSLSGTALRSFGLKLGFTVLVQGGLWTFAGMEHESVGSFVYGEAVKGIDVLSDTKPF